MLCRALKDRGLVCALLGVMTTTCATPEPTRTVPVAASEASTPAGAPSSMPRAEASTTARPRIVFLGDSLTAGYGLEKSQAVPALIQERVRAAGYDYEVVNAGVSGDTSAGGLSRLEWALEGDVRILVVELGANDGLRGLPTEQMAANLSEIVSRAKARDIAVVLTGMEAPPNYGAAYTKAYRQVFADLAKRESLAFVPFYLEGVAGIPRLNIADGIHPNPEGARIVADTVWNVLEPVAVRARR